MKSGILKILLICVLLLVLAGCESADSTEIQYTKIDDNNRLPANKILGELFKGRESLQRGTWQFLIGDPYGTEYLYFAVCGGPEYKDGYDVEIKEIDYTSKLDDQGEIESVEYRIYVEEKSAKTWTVFPDGFNHFEYPFVIFRIDTKFGDADSLAGGVWVDDPTDTGKPPRRIEIELLDNEILRRDPVYDIETTKITAVEDVPQKILDNMNKVKLERGLWLFDEYFSGSDDIYFMVCGGPEFADGYDVEINEVTYDPGSATDFVPGYMDYTPHITETLSDYTMPYSEGLQYPVVLFRIDTRFGKDDKIVNGAYVWRGVGEDSIFPGGSSLPLRSNFVYK